MKSKNFAKNLRLQLERRGVNQIELAEKAGLSSAAIHYFVTGKREPSLSSVVAIINALGIKFEKLVA